MTSRQKDCLSFVEKFWKKNGYSPSYDEIREGIRLKSKSGVHALVARLVAQGYLLKEDRRARSLRPAHPSA